jgi:hypothetical protein
MKVLQRVLIAVVVLIVAVPVVAVVGFSLWWHHVTTGPDVRKEVRTSAFQKQRASTVAILDQDLATFVSTAPRGARMARAVFDTCGRETAFFGERPQMTCNRQVSVYLALDGDLTGLQRTWTESLAAAHWRKGDEQPPAGYQTYNFEFVESPSVRVVWNTRPKAPEPARGFQNGIPQADSGTRIMLEQQPADLAKVFQDGYAHHRYVVELSTSAQYYPTAPKAPRSPSPTPSSPWDGCYGGHGNCPGG